VTSGADVDTQDKTGWTSFQIAVLQENKALADFFLSKGAKQQPPPGMAMRNITNYAVSKNPNLKNHEKDER
jgi:ankyrin repeat protein